MSCYGKQRRATVLSYNTLTSHPLIHTYIHPHTHTDPLFITKSVGELLWGYNDTLLADLNVVLDKLNVTGLAPPAFFALQGNNSAVYYSNYSTVYTGKVGVWEGCVNGI